MKAKTYLFLMFVFPALVSVAVGQSDPATVKTDHCVTNVSLCLECHSREEMETRYTDSSRSCDNACFKCHKNMEGHHKTGMEVDFKVPTEIKLTSENRVACVTCHNLKVERFGSQCRKAQSLFARVFSTKKQHKSYYLVMDNRKGQLCKKCH
jgi:hypothetical protein